MFAENRPRKVTETYVSFSYPQQQEQDRGLISFYKINSKAKGWVVFWEQ